MKTASIRDLRYDFQKVEAWLNLGESVRITKHKKAVGVLQPPPEEDAGSETFELPDYEARLKRIWGDRVFTEEEVEEMRAFETGEP